MKVENARYTDGRTEWPLVLGPFDAHPPSNHIWLSGYHHNYWTNDLHGLWLTTVLRSCCAHQLEVSAPISVELHDALTKLAGSIQISPLLEMPAKAYLGETIGVLVRDELDAFLAEVLFDDDVIRVSVSGDQNTIGRIRTTFPVTSNAGWIVRQHDPLDSTGDLATLVRVAPMYSLGRIVTFLSAQEFGTLDPGLFSSAAEIAGVHIINPFGDLDLKALRSLLGHLGMPPRLIERSWNRRYWMSPDICNLPDHSPTEFPRSVHERVMRSGLPPAMKESILSIG
jgi:hypothetical protein